MKLHIFLMRITPTRELCMTPSSSVWSPSPQAGGSAETADVHNPSGSSARATLDNETVIVICLCKMTRNAKFGLA